MGIVDFIQDEILGMKWLNRLIGSLLNACGLDTSGKIGGSMQFFIYDVGRVLKSAEISAMISEMQDKPEANDE